MLELAKRAIGQLAVISLSTNRQMRFNCETHSRATDTTQLREERLDLTVP